MLLRGSIILTTWYVAITSPVFKISSELRTDIFGTRSQWVGFIVTLVKILLILIIELLFTISIDQDDEIKSIPVSTSQRWIQGNVLMLMSEIMLLVTLVLELEDLKSIVFVKGILTSASFFEILRNPSSIVTHYFVIIFYIMAILVYMYPRKSDPIQRSMESMALVLSLRSIILPV